MRLSENFTLAELTRSQLATRLGLNNQPNERGLDQLKRLVDEVLQPLREAVGLPVTVTSGYRSPLLCHKLGSSRSSMHTYGAAADIHVHGMSPRDVARLASTTPEIAFGRIILEFPEDGWVHIESQHPANRRRAGPLLIARRGLWGKTGYSYAESF